MGHPVVEYDIAAAAWLFFSQNFFFFPSRFSPLFHDFFLNVFFFLSFNRDTYAMTCNFFIFFQLCLSLFSSSLFQYLMGVATCMYVCRHAPFTQFSKIVPIEGRFFSSFTISSSCFFVFFVRGLFLGVLNRFLFSKSYLISSWVVSN